MASVGTVEVKLNTSDLVKQMMDQYLVTDRSKIDFHASQSVFFKSLGDYNRILYGSLPGPPRPKVYVLAVNVEHFRMTCGEAGIDYRDAVYVSTETRHRDLEGLRITNDDVIFGERCYLGRDYQPVMQELVRAGLTLDPAVAWEDF